VVVAVAVVVAVIVLVGLTITNISLLKLFFFFKTLSWKVSICLNTENILDVGYLIQKQKRLKINIE